MSSPHANHQGEPGDTGTGWVLVPREPTEAMCEAAAAECRRMVGVMDPVMHIWDVMLASAPTPPDQVGEEVGRDHVVSARLIPWEPGSLGGVDLTFESGLRVALPLSAGEPAPSSDPAGAGGDLGELERLSKAAGLTEELWRQRSTQGLGRRVIRCAGYDVAECDPSIAAFIVALVNAYRSGKLVASTGSEEETKGLQARNADWMRIAFADDPTDLPERIARFGEEALELQQALGQSRADALALVNYVYSRPAGAPVTELGQTAGSLACLAEFAGHDLEAAAEAELDRVSTPEFLAKLRAKRATRHGRGPLPGFSAPGTSEPEAMPKQSPSPRTETDPPMSVEEAQDWLDSFDTQPGLVAADYRRRCKSPTMAPEVRATLLKQASRIELALRTLQAAGEVRHG